MHPYFTQAVAADRVAEWRSDAAASRRAREDAAAPSGLAFSAVMLSPQLRSRRPV